nr:DNA packaging tegument protein UL25 [Psittacid alphaherpesvirus 6]
MGDSDMTTLTLSTKSHKRRSTNTEVRHSRSNDETTDTESRLVRTHIQSCPINDRPDYATDYLTEPASFIKRQRLPDPWEEARKWRSEMDREPTSFVFDAVLLGAQRHDMNSQTFLPDRRNFISPPWPRNFWARPQFTTDRTDTETRLAVATARTTAAVAALENLQAVVMGNATYTDRVLQPLAKHVKKTAEALGDLERAASEAEEADASAEVSCRAAENTLREGEMVDDGMTIAREVQIVKNDPKLRYDTNLPVDLLVAIYTSRAASGSSGVSMGTWYRTLQDTLVAERPIAARRLDTQNGRMSKTFVTTVVTSLQSTSRLYVGNRHYTALEAACLCLYAYSASTGGAGSSRPPGSFLGLLSELATYLDELADALSTSGTRPKYAFNTESLPKTSFVAPGGGRYEKDALAGHSVLVLLQAARVLPAAPGAIGKEGVSADVDVTDTAYDDRVNTAAAAILGRAQPLFLMVDQTLLRCALDTVTALLLLRRLLWNTNVYGDRTANSFQLGSIMPTGGASENTVDVGVGLPREAVKSDGRNFAFLLRNYVSPLYANDRTLEITQLFPGLAIICLEAAVGGLAAQPRGTRRRVLDVSAARGNANLLKLIALELENRGKTNVVSVREVIETHDSVAMQYEKGLSAAMTQLRAREAFFGSGKAAAFNVSTDYDLHYFMCLAYVPKFTSAI